jgi:hypothetical protein
VCETGATERTDDALPIGELVMVLAGLRIPL